jgi:hypothetical protein
MTHMLDGLHRLALLKNVVFRKLHLLPSSGRNVKRILLRILGKAVPLQAWTGPEGSKKLRLPDF